MPTDLDKYRSYLEGYDLNEAQQAELIHTLWTIMEGFADRAFGLHPVQQCPVSLPSADSNDAPDRVDSREAAPTSHFKHAVGPSQRRKDTDDEGE